MKKMKRLFALVIAFAMLIGFVPSGFFMYSAGADWAGESATVTYVLPDFSKLSTDLSSFDSVNKTFTGETAVTNTNWYSDGNYSASSIKIDKYARLVYKATNAAHFVSINIQLPSTPGKYTLKLPLLYSTSSIDTFLFDNNKTVVAGDLVTTATEYLTTVNTSSAAGAQITFDAGVIEVTNATAGTFKKLVIKASSSATAGEKPNNVGAYGFYLPASFSLDGTAPAELSSVTGVAVKENLLPGESTTLSVSGKLTTNKDANLTGATIVYTNLSESIVTLEGNTVTYKDEGKATIRVSVTLEGVTKTDDIEIWCVNPYSLSEITFTTDKDFIKDDEKAQLSVTGKLVSGSEADLSAATVIYSSKNPEIASVDAQTGVVSSVGNGTATLSVSVTLDKVTKTAELTISCYKSLPFAGEENSVAYKFAAPTANEDDITTFTEYNAEKNTNWKYLASKGGSAFRSFYAYCLRFISSATKGDVWTAFKLKAPKTGRYTGYFNYASHVGALGVDLYLLPGDTSNIAAALESATPFASVDYVAQEKNQKLGLIDIDNFGGAEVIFVVKTSKFHTGKPGGAGTGGFAITDLILQGAEPSYIDSVNLALATDTLVIGSTVNASVSATLENGKAANLSEDNLADIKFTSSDDTVAKVSADGEITALKTGKATITATVTLDGVTKSASRELVCVNYGGESTSNEINLMAGLAESGENVDALTEYNTDKNARWIYFGNYMNIAGRAVTKNGAVKFIGMDDGAWSAIKFKSTTEGAYKLKLAYKNHIGAKNAKVFVFTGDTELSDINALLSNTAPIGTFEYAEGEQIVEIGSLAVRKNTEYILVLQADGITNNGDEGYATLTATKLIFDGKEPEVIVPKLSKISLNIAKNLAIGGAAIATVAGKLDDGSDADLSGATVAYSSSNTNVVTIDKTTGAMLGVAGGSALITATVTLGDVTKDTSETVEVLTEYPNPSRPGAEHSVVYDFVSCLARSGEDVAPLTEYNAEKNTNWAYVKHSSGEVGKARSFYGALRIYNENADEYVVFKLKAPTPGLYSGTLAYSGSATAKKAEVYLLPGNTDPSTLEAQMAITPAVAIYDVVASALGELQTVNLGALSLTGQTDYYLVLKCTEISTGVSGNPGSLYLNTVTLSGAKPLDSLKSKLDNDSDTNNVIAVGSSCGILKETPSVPTEAAQATYTYSSSNEEIATVSADGVVSAHKAGYATISVTGSLEGETKTATFDIIAGSLKSRRTIVPDETIEIMRANFEKYDWAASTLKTTIKDADKYVDRYEEICDMITTNALPRGVQAYADPYFAYCRYCGENLAATTGGFISDPLNVKWKVQCSACRRYFPSNDFGSYYKLGLDEHGIWDPKVSKQKNDEIIANGGDGYLKNILYPEKDKEHDVVGWGVDNGFGYDTGKYYPAPNDTVKELHVYIPRYNHNVWTPAWSHTGGGPINNALYSLSDAYMYTGEEKYGIAGAVILDRVADIYPTMHLDPAWRRVYVSSSGGSGKGTVVGRILDTNLAVRLADSYDALWPAMENPKVIQILSERAKELKLDNPKTSADLIRYNCDNGILRAIRKGIETKEIWGNFGKYQYAMASAAVALDTFPETGEWIDWLFEPSETGVDGETGNMDSTLVGVVDRDGWGDEGSPGYNQGWINSVCNIADRLNVYKDTYAGGDLYGHPKYRRMIFACTELTMANRYYPNIGDAGQFGKTGNLSNLVLFKSVWQAGIHDDNIARMIYQLCDGDLSDLNTGITSKDPYAIQREVQAVVDEKGVMLDLGSKNLAGYGLMITRDGQWKIANNSIDTQRSYWMYYGRNTGHGDHGTLNLGLVAYGIDMSPDLGNPDFKTINSNRLTWSSTPMAHNTVFVVEENGADYGATYSNATENGIVSGDPYHFDDSGKVKVMDVDVPELYKSAEIFRRTVVEVDYNDDVSYAVDFFRVKGGEDHIYNFHAQSEEIEVDIPMSAQVDENGSFVGSYAGPEIPYGDDELWANAWTTPLKSPAGFSWLKNVYRAANPTASTISADFKIKDYFNVLPGNPDLHMKLTMLNTGGEITEFAYGDTRPPVAPGSPALIKQIMARRQGKDLDSLYTTVIQPYKDNPYIEKVEEVPVAIKSGYEGKNDAARAVKVTLTTGRVDYIVYATNNTVTYTVDNKFDMRAFVGVVTYEPGVEAPIYTYMNDGTFLAGMNGTDKYTGKVVDFTRELSLDNSITVEFDGSFDVNELVGQYIYIDNGSRSNSQANSTYKIEGAEVDLSDPSKVKLDVGMTTTILNYVDATDETKGFNYLMGKGMDFEIPLPIFDEKNPIVNAIPKQRVEAGNTLTFKVTATSQTGKPLSYKLKDKAEGMIFDEQTQTFTWSPTTADRGDNIASFIVSDGLLETQFYVEIEVANPTGGSVAGGDTFPSGGGGGGGGGSDDPKPDDPTDDPNTDEPGTDEPGTTPGGDSGKKFIDLGAHSWAEDAIYELVDAGVINGTSANTYSPAKNITRADFATLAVRLFKFEGEAETFSDVPADKYYAESVGIAKANGIVNGISETEFAPMKEISREEMMVMLYRALKAAGIELPETVELTHSDFDEVSDYAKEAVEALIKSGLIAGSNGKINPKGKATRAEVAVVLSRINALISK